MSCSKASRFEVCAQWITSTKCIFRFLMSLLPYHVNTRLLSLTAAREPITKKYHGVRSTRLCPIPCTPRSHIQTSAFFSFQLRRGLESSQIVPIAARISAHRRGDRVHREVDPIHRRGFSSDPQLIGGEQAWYGGRRASGVAGGSPGSC